MSKRKKIVVLGCMIALLVTTAVLNFVLSSSVLGKDDSAVTETANYFTEIKTTRNSSRNKQIAQLDDVIAQSEENSEERKEALAMKIKLAEIVEQENLLENLIRAKGYQEVAVNIGMTSDNVSVIVRDADFTQDDAVLIYTICASEVNASPENVYIQSIS
ncbi:MAG: SpoIIIAH-like family protein [Candidatus Borkfalkiaceae bacterium]|nr:SpoIIIAH-like family protein [Christensenellaceae bacterium]